MKGPILVAGDFAHAIYEPDFCWGLREAYAEVIEFPVLRFFGPGRFLRSAQSKFARGPGPTLANAALLAQVARTRPRVVLAWRTPWLFPATVRLCQVLGARVVLHNNDDPFGPDRDLPIWRAFRQLIPAADLCLSYREINVSEFWAAGARDVGVLRSWYNPTRHHPIELTRDDRAAFESDVTFVGHAENDGRLEVLEALQATGLKVRLFGTGWDSALRESPLSTWQPVHAVRGQDYPRAIAAAKVALVFLSGRNRDTYTRRCFEIPAIGTLMLAPRNTTLEAMFESEREAMYFDDVRDAARQALRCVGDPAMRERVAAAGRERCLRDGHDVVSRAREFLERVDLGNPSHG